MSYSQSDEEQHIIGALQKAGIEQGRFLDIGAYDGKAFSNTMRLVELGWGGVCVEPSPTVFPALLKLHGDNPNIELINAAISAREVGLIDFYDSGGDAISTTNPAHVQKWTAGHPVHYKKFLVHALPLSALFKRFGYFFDFINIDVESTNVEIFDALPIPLLERTRLICIEYDFEADYILSRVAPHGFVEIHRNGENLIMAR